MRVNIPLLPLVVTIERRPLRPRASLRAFMIVIVGLAVYLSTVTLPARRERYERADRAIREQMELLVRAAEEDREQERSLRTRYEKDVVCAEVEEKEAAKWPADSADARSHREIAGLWLKAARAVPLGTADAAGRRVKAIEQWVETLRQGPRGADGSLATFESFARGIRDLLTSEEWVRLGIAEKIDQVAGKIRSERRDETIRAIVASDPTR